MPVAFSPELIDSTTILRRLSGHSALVDEGDQSLLKPVSNQQPPVAQLAEAAEAGEHLRESFGFGKNVPQYL